MSERKIERGQIWRNKKSGKEVVVEHVIELSKSIEYPYQDVRFYTIPTTGRSRRGACYSEYWHKNYEYLRVAR